MLPNTGSGLEARVQRLFMALGCHAERGLVVRTGRSERTKMATDIDILATNYSANFHRSVFHAECKGERSTKTLDRSFWLVGVRRFLGADRSLLVIPSCDVQTSEFARELDIEILGIDALESMERAYQLPEKWWPGRSDFRKWDPLQLGRAKYSVLPDIHPSFLELVQGISHLCFEEGWRELSYGSLNRLLRLLGELGNGSSVLFGDERLSDIARLAVSTALVRLADYMLGVCRDLAVRPQLDRARYIADRLTFGDHDAGYISGVIERYSSMVKTALSKQHVSLPERWSSGNLLQSPKYLPALTELIERLLDYPEHSIYLPYAMEFTQFGFEPEPRGTVKTQVDAGRPAVELVKALLVQEFAISPRLLEPPDTDALTKLLRQGAGKSANQP